MHGNGSPNLSASLSLPPLHPHWSNKRNHRTSVWGYCITILHCPEPKAGSINRSVRFIRAFEFAISMSIWSEVHPHPKPENTNASDLQLVTLKAPIMLNFDSVRP